MSTKHTPGPWRVNIGNCTQILRPDGHYIASMRARVACSSAETETLPSISNAFLMAAAPDLLEATRLALAALNDPGDLEKEQAAHAALSTALSKAVRP